MKKDYKILFFFSFIVLLLACENNDDVDCTNVIPAPNWFELGFFDSQGLPMIGNVYQQDEFRIFNSNSENFISPTAFGDPTRLQVFFPDFVTNTKYYIELTAVDIDTLNFIFETKQDPCFLNYDLKQVIYNGEINEVQNTNRVDLIK